jgi:hypothetical protein
MGIIMIDDKLNQIFDIEPAPKQEIVTREEAPNEDIEKVKKVHHDLLDKSQDALDNLLEFAKASESPRAYEVVANLIKTTADVAKNLADISMKETKSKPEVQNNTQNNLFIGSTAELQKFLKGNRDD